MNIIADVAGQYNGLVRLLEKMPQERTVFLGDLIDRGPDSKKVVELVRTKHECVAANHEHFMIDWVRKRGWYDDGLWLANGGRVTLTSYNCDPFEAKFNKAMEEDVAWMESLPLYIETNDLFLSHAPWRSWDSLDEACRVLGRGFAGMRVANPNSLLWCRDTPQDRKFKDEDGLSAPPFGKRKIQMFGHNSYWGIRPFYANEESKEVDIEDLFNGSLISAVTNPVPIEVSELYAICLDNSMMRRLTGAHFDEESKRIFIYQEGY